MPNWCSNTLIVKGTKRRLDAFIKKMASFDSDGDTGHALTFHAVVPMPKYIRNEDGPGNGWYNWSIEHWGTKWDAKSSFCRRISPTCVEFTFDTAWSQPQPWFEALADAYPQLDLTLRYVEEGAGFAGECRAYDGDLGTENDLNPVEALISWNGFYEVSCEECYGTVSVTSTPVPETLICDECAIHVCRNCGKRDSDHAESKCLFDTTTFVPLGQP